MSLLSLVLLGMLLLSNLLWYEFFTGFKDEVRRRLKSTLTEEQARRLGEKDL